MRVQVPVCLHAREEQGGNLGNRDSFMNVDLPLAEPDPLERKSHLFGPQSQELWYKMAIGEGESVAQCFECMRVCPIARTAPAADPVKRWKLRQEIPLQST